MCHHVLRSADSQNLPPFSVLDFVRGAVGVVSGGWVLRLEPSMLRTSVTFDSLDSHATRSHTSRPHMCTIPRRGFVCLKNPETAERVQDFQASLGILSNRLAILSNNKSHKDLRPCIKDHQVSGLSVLNATGQCNGERPRASRAHISTSVEAWQGC